jgi:uncharacterized protein
MQLDLSEIVIRDGMKVGLDIDQASVEDPELEFIEPLKGHLTFDHGGDLINIHGHVDAALTVPCSRCLNAVRLPVSLELNEHLPIDDVLNPNRPPAEGEEYDTMVSSIVYLDQTRPILDLDELMRQLIIAELPIRTLCDEDCAGLCPICGENRNENPCECEAQERNTPLAALGALLKQNGDTEA